MGITVNDEKGLFCLSTKETSYVIGIADKKYVGHVYYGQRLSSDKGLEDMLHTNEYPFVPSKNLREKCAFTEAFPFEMSGCGTGDFRSSALMVRTEDGYRACEPVYESYRVIDGKPVLEGLPSTFETDTAHAQTLEIICRDKCIGLKMILRYSIFEDSDAIIRSVLLENEGTAPLAIEKIMSACIEMDNEDFEMMTLHGAWGRERQISRYPLHSGMQSTGSVCGKSSHQAHPFMALMTPETTQTQGEVYAMNFVYSGNFIAEAQCSQFGLVRMQMGIHPDYFEWKLEPGAIFTAPEVVCVYSAAGLGKMTRTFHDLYRQHLIRSPYLHKQRPILINNWEATYFDFDADKLTAIAKGAHRHGIEMLVMDDGWFGRRSDDNSSLGDWTVNEEKLGCSLNTLVERIKAEGLKFGIWFEPEMISPDSDLYRTHPDWALQIPGREATLSRCQYVLDLSRKEVRDYAYQSIAKVLKSADISYVKWDMNRALTDVGSACLDASKQGELLHRYMLGVYEMQERLVTEFPDLLIENCSGGGGRFDPGMLYYSPQIWCSDDTDAVERLSIQEGTALIYPLSTMGAHVSDCPNHIVGRSTPFKTRGDVALAGTFGYELDITKISKEDQAMIDEQVEMYHKYNQLVREGDYFRLASWSQNHSYDCWVVAAKDQSEVLVTYVQVMAHANYKSRKIKLQGFDAEKYYQLEGTDRIYSGDVLMNAGFLVKTGRGDFKSTLYHFIEISDK